MENKDRVNITKLLNEQINENGPKNVEFDEECILFERPNIEDEDLEKLENKTEKSGLNLYE